MILKDPLSRAGLRMTIGRVTWPEPALPPAEPYISIYPPACLLAHQSRRRVCGAGVKGCGGVKNSVAKVEEIMRILTFNNFFLQCLIIFKCHRELEWLLNLRT